MWGLIPFVWAGAVVAVLVRGAQPTFTILVSQVAVGLSYVLLLASRTGWDERHEHRAITLATATWRSVDQRVVDSAIDGIGLIVCGWSDLLRRAQAGSVRIHAAAALAGVLVMVGYLLWR